MVSAMGQMGHLQEWWACGLDWITVMVSTVGQMGHLQEWWALWVGLDTTIMVSAVGQMGHLQERWALSWIGHNSNGECCGTDGTSTIMVSTVGWIGHNNNGECCVWWALWVIIMVSAVGQMGISPGMVSTMGYNNGECCGTDGDISRYGEHCGL